MSKQTPEGAVKAAICEFLTIHGIRHFRMNAGMTVLSGANGKRRMIRGHEPGTADILAFPRVKIAFDGDQDWIRVPVPLWIEVKRETGGRVSDAQRVFLASVENEGHLTLVATSIDVVAAKLREIGAI